MKSPKIIASKSVAPKPLIGLVNPATLTSIGSSQTVNEFNIIKVDICALTPSFASTSIIPIPITSPISYLKTSDNLTQNKKILAIIELFEKEISDLKTYKVVNALSLILVLSSQKRIPKKVWAHVRELLLTNRLLQTLIISINFSPHISSSSIKKIMPHLRMKHSDPVENIDLSSLLSRENMESIQHLPDSIDKAHEKVSNLLVVKEKMLIISSVSNINPIQSKSLKSKTAPNFKI